MKACLSVIVLLSATSLYGQLSDFSGTGFRKADSIAALYPLHPLADLKLLSDKLTEPLSTDVEKFRSIFTWVCSNIESDYELFVENKNMRRKLSGEKLRRWEEKFSERVFNIMTAQHRTICTGYAYLVKELAFHAGLNCKIVDGYSRNARTNIGGSGVVNHSWNAVALDGKWYLCDPTWSSGVIDGASRTFKKRFHDVYFLPEPALFGRSHYPLDSKWMLQEKKPTLHTFLNAPLIYVGSFRYDVAPVTPASFEIQVERGSDVPFQFTKGNKNEISRMALYVESSRASEPFTKELQGDVAVYSTSHKFSHQGKYAVHIVLDGNHVLSYNVRVQ